MLSFFIYLVFFKEFCILGEAMTFIKYVTKKRKKVIIFFLRGEYLLFENTPIIFFLFMDKKKTMSVL